MKFFAALFFCTLMSMPAYAQFYGSKICKESGYHCYKVQSGDTWNRLFPDEEDRELVKRLNRTNLNIHKGMVIAVPNDLDELDIMDISPFPLQVSPSNTNFIQVDQSDMAWGAYSADGSLVNWGPISGGKNYCPDVGRKCNTVTGSFTIYRKQGAGCASSKYPIGKGGAKMPYCMFFHGGYALHGSYAVPGVHASHGCVRLFVEDAEWLNTDFIDVGRTKVFIRH